MAWNMFHGRIERHAVAVYVAINVNIVWIAYTKHKFMIPVYMTNTSWFNITYTDVAWMSQDDMRCLFIEGSATV